MRILIVGDWYSEVHEEVASTALRSLGHQVEEFKWSHYFKSGRGIFGRFLGLIRRAQNKYVAGPIINLINKDLLNHVRHFQPEMLFVYRGTHITANTLRSIKKFFPNCILVGYNNDDPFSPNRAPFLWGKFLAAVPAYDLVLAYRNANIPEYLKAGAARVELLRSWFVPERNYPVELSAIDRNRFDADVVFAGHYEPDQRLDYLEEIVRQGFRLRLFGPGWDDAIVKKSALLAPLAPVRQLWGEDYNKALCGAKIALCFFSKLNRDTYTRRCFEIPATGTLLLSEYSDDIASLFREGEEADYFKTREEMLAKIKNYLSNDNSRMSVAAAGNLRVNEDGHDVRSRMMKVVEWVEALR